MLWSRLGPHDPAELDRLLWEERKLVEWHAYIWPIEDLPLLRARMRRRKHGRNLQYEWERRGAAFLKENASFRRYVLRELDKRGPLLGRELEDRSARQREKHPWWGARDVGIMLELLQVRGEIAIVGRRGKQRLWDLAERWYPPETERVSHAEAQRASRRSAGGLPASGSSRASGTRTPTRWTSRSTIASRSSRRSTG